MEDCLEALHALGAARAVVPVPAVAQWLGMRPALAAAVIEHLAGGGLVEGSAEGSASVGARLTPRGRQEVTRVVRRRRLLESVLMASYGYPLPAAQVIAARLAYAVSDELVDDAARIFGEPDLTPNPERAPAWAVAMRAHLAQSGRTAAGTCRPLEPAAAQPDPRQHSPRDPFLWPTLPLAKGESDA